MFHKIKKQCTIIKILYYNVYLCKLSSTDKGIYNIEDLVDQLKDDFLDMPALPQNTNK